MVHKTAEQKNSLIFEDIKNRYNPFYGDELGDEDALEILQSMNALIKIQHSFLHDKRGEIVPKKVYNLVVTKYDE
jgi:hypothetical protein